MAVELAAALGFSDEDLVQLRRGALLHDIGKVGIPDVILLKPGRLTDEERAIMQTHPRLAHEILAPIEFLRPALDVPYAHHEAWNGSGYPRGLRGLEIPYAARVFSVIDVWDALRSDRPYRSAWTVDAASEYIAQNAGELFDPEVVEWFTILSRKWTQAT